MFTIDQRPFKKAIREALGHYQGPESVDTVLNLYDAAVQEHPNYLNHDAVREQLHRLLRVNNRSRAEKLVNVLPDVTSSRLVVGFLLLLKFAFGLFLLVVFVGLVGFLYQWFFG